MATHQDCWSGKNKDEAQEWLSNLSIGEKLLHPPPQMEYNKTTPTGDKFEQVVIKEKTDNYVVISYPNRNEQWDKKLPLKYAFAVRPIGDNSNEDDDLSNLSQSSNNSNTSDASIVSPNNTIPFPPINNNDNNNNNNNNNIKNNSNHVTMTFKKTKKKHKKKLHPFRDNNKILVAKSPSPSPTPTTNTNNNIPEITPPAADKTCFNKLHYTRSQTTTYKPLKHTYAETRSKNARNRNIFKKSLKKKGHKIQDEQRQNYQKTRTEIDNRISKIEEEEEKKEQAKKKQKLQEENSGQCNGGSSSGYSRHGYNNGYSRYGYNNNNNGSDDDENNRPMTRSRYNSSMQQHSYESYKNGIIPSWITSAPNALLSEPIGLVNMGNTCFMNSTLQSLIHTSELRQFFLNNNNNKWITQQLNIDNPIGYKGQIAMNFSKLIYKMCDESVNGSHGYYSNSVRPSMIHWNLSGVLRQFADYRQHDAQEFMTNFLDALHEDLNRIKKKKYIEIPDFDKYEENNQTKRQFLYKRWHQIYLNRNNSICTDLFAGLLKSAVTCPKCNFTAITFDPFMHLLVPLKCKSNLFKNNITNYYNHNRYNNNNNNNNINEKCEITFILLPKNSLDEPEEYNIKINKDIIDTNDWIRFNAKIYDYLLGRLTNYTCEPKHDKYRCQMIKSGEFHSSYLYYGKKFISTMKDFLSGSFTIPKCIANDKIVELPMFEIYELFEQDKILYLNDICNENYNTKINEYILNKGHRRLIIHELPQHWSDKDRLSMEMDQKIETFIVFKKPLNINENNDNKQREEDEYIPYEPFNFPRLIFEKGLTGKINYIKLNKYLYKQSKNIVIGICGDKIDEKINLNQEMEIRYSTSDDFTLNKINTYQKVDLNCDNNNNNNNNNNNYKPQSIKTMVIIFSFKMQQLYIEYQRNKEQHNNSNGKKRSFEEANINNENINNNNHNNPRKKQKLNHNNNNNNDNKNKNKNKNNNINILPKKFQVKNSTASTIEECFGMYLSSEQLGKDNKWYCKKCKLHVQGRKQLTLWWLPKYLIIVIKRFENHGLRKCTSHVRYPVTGLDLTQLIGGKDSLDIYYDKNNNKNNNKYKDKQFIYDLYAVINHSGSLNFGHYTATIKYNKKWYDISDSCVSDCHNPVSSQAYILCYKQQSN